MKNLLSWLKDNIGLTVGAIISLGVLGCIYYFEVYTNYAKEEEVAAKLEQKRGELDSLLRRKPFPHAENVVILSNTVVALSGADPNLSVARWLTNLASVNPPLRNIRPSAFNPMLVQQKNKLMAGAKKYGVTVPQEFGFGFGRYVTHGTPPANDTNEINTLLTQWNTVETLADILFTNRIVSIAAIRRAPVGAEIPKDPGVAGMAMPTVRAGSDEFFGTAMRDDPSEIARALPFELEFTCDTQGLRGILSALESSARFFIVRSIAVLNTRANEMLAGGRSEAMGRTPTAADASAEPPPAPEAPVPGAPGGRPASSRGEASKLAEPVTVFGLEKIQVKMRVDLVEFREPSSSGANPPGGK
ncbi:MAG: Amuc_1100 family pilus-like protein [Verrucomicrobia bacterium]|nr:Amuc_1100 family pilus-like protein [Verrucomicrobiota bacterium]